MPDRLIKGDIARLPEANVRNDNWFQRLLLTWVYGIVSAGRAGLLRQDSLAMPRDQAAEEASARFQAAWDVEKAASQKADALSTPGPRRTPSMLRALMATFGQGFAAAGALKLLWSTFVLLGASYFVNALVEFVQKKAGWDALPNKGVGWALSCSFFLDSVFAGLALQRMGDVSARCVGVEA
jgi:ATP-binding cassette, subfamily C (CFTR/MRP), member 1